MKIIKTEKIGRLGFPIIEIYNQQSQLVYEVHDEIECEFFSIELLDIMENDFEIHEQDIIEISSILKNAWITWANLDNENKIYDIEKFQQLVKLFREQESEDRYILIQEIVALLGKGVNRYGEKMKAMSELLDEKLDEILLYQGRGKPNVESLEKGYEYLKNNLALFCEKKGLLSNGKLDKIKYKIILNTVLNEDHMCVFKQLKIQ